jgi:hypothetical protein
LGFRLAGLKLKNKSGEINTNLNGKELYGHIKTRQDVLEALINVLKSNDSETINVNALKASIKLIEQIIHFIKNISKRYFYEFTNLGIFERLRFY